MASRSTRTLGDVGFALTLAAVSFAGTIDQESFSAVMLALLLSAFIESKYCYSEKYLSSTSDGNKISIACEGLSEGSISIIYVSSDIYSSEPDAVCSINAEPECITIVFIVAFVNVVTFLILLTIMSRINIFKSNIYSAFAHSTSISYNKYVNTQNISLYNNIQIHATCVSANNNVNIGKDILTNGNNIIDVQYVELSDNNIAKQARESDMNVESLNIAKSESPELIALMVRSNKRENYISMRTINDTPYFAMNTPQIQTIDGKPSCGKDRFIFEERIVHRHVFLPVFLLFTTYVVYIHLSVFGDIIEKSKCTFTCVHCCTCLELSKSFLFMALWLLL